MRVAGDRFLRQSYRDHLLELICMVVKDQDEVADKSTGSLEAALNLGLKQRELPSSRTSRENRLTVVSTLSRRMTVGQASLSGLSLVCHDTTLSLSGLQQSENGQEEPGSPQIMGPVRFGNQMEVNNLKRDRRRAVRRALTNVEDIDA